MNEFYRDLTRGSIGEQLVFNTLSSRGSKVIDLRDNEEARWNDIDCALEKEGKKTTLEIKTDYASERTGNFFIEDINNNNYQHNYDGWYRYCKAEYICFVQEKAKKAYIVLVEELRQVINNHRWNIASGTNAIGFLLPLSSLLDFNSLICLELS